MAEWLHFVALHVAHYRQRYGDVSIEESLEMLRTEKVSDEMAKVLSEGFGVLVEFEGPLSSKAEVEILRYVPVRQAAVG